MQLPSAKRWVYLYSVFMSKIKDGERKKYDVVGKVLAVKELENRRGMFEHRVQYYNLDVNTREEIIRFIFEEERKSRKKERLN